MRRVMFALFESAGHEEAALRELEALGIPRESCRVAERRGQISEAELLLVRSGRARGLTRGLLTGVAAGGVLGPVIGGLSGLVPGGPLAVAAAAGLMGSLLAGLVGALTGLGRLRRRLRRLARELDRGQVLLTLDPQGSALRYSVRRIFHKHGARLIREAAALPSPAAR